MDAREPHSAGHVPGKAYDAPCEREMEPWKRVCAEIFRSPGTTRSIAMVLPRLRAISTSSTETSTSSSKSPDKVRLSAPGLLASSAVLAAARASAAAFSGPPWHRLQRSQPLAPSPEFVS